MKTFLTPAFLLTVLSLSAACGDDAAGTGGAGSGSGGSDGGSGPTSSSTTVSGPTSTSGSSTASTSSGEGGSGTSSGGGEGGSGTSSGGGEGGSGTSSGGGEGGSGTSSGGGEGGSGTSSVSSGGGQGGASVSVTTGGPGDCIEITPEQFVAVSNGDYNAAFGPEVLTADDDILRVEFYEGGGFNGAAVGTFDLTTGGDENYATCSRCVRAIADVNAGTPTQFFVSGGTLVLNADSEQLNSAVDGTLTDVTLVEVTIDADTFVSTPVPNGICLYLASAPVAVGGGGVPAEWTCDAGWYGDSDPDVICDCGCGAVDPNCADATAASCAFCATAAEGGCNESLMGCPGTIDPANNAVCSVGGVPAEWTCDPDFYEAADGCDCGCGAVDPDCADESVGSCAFCDNTGSCSTVPGCPGDIDPLDNSTCSGAGWTCDIDFFGTNDGCDCGCGITDPDCADSTVASCAFCDNTGSCSALDCPGDIDPTDNAVCN